MVLTPQDLADWNSNPVTQEIFKEIDIAIEDKAKESTLRDTVDQTAMQASRNEGMIEGAQLLKDTYEYLKETIE